MEGDKGESDVPLDANQIAQIARTGRSLQRFGMRVAKIPVETAKFFNMGVSAFSTLLGTFSQTLAILLVLFIVHQLFIWVDQDPEVAFERGALVFEVVEIVWDSVGVGWNAVVDIVNAGVLPIWNSLAYYVAEPVIILLFEVFFLIIGEGHYQGVLDSTDPENDVYKTHFDCMTTWKAAEFCGRYAAYAEALESDKYAAAYTDQSTVYREATRRLLLELYDNTTEPVYPRDPQFVMGIATARRLQGDVGFATPTFNMDAITDAMLGFSTILNTLFPPLCDIFFSLFFEILPVMFSFIVDGIFTLLKGAMFVVKMLFKSGMISTVINLGSDFLIILLTEIALPSLFAAIDLVKCIIDFFQPSTWNAQLDCVDQRCFKGPNIVADLLVFWHMPVVLHRFTAIMQATMNSRTGRRFFGTPDRETFNTDGRVVDPETGRPVPTSRTESAQMPNPVYGFDFADKFKEFLPTTGADQCGGCFNCKWPEIRLVWLLVASIGSLFSEKNFNQFVGNLTETCLANGSWYEQACGPRGAELLTYTEWMRQGYTAGYVEIDARLFDSYSAAIIDRSHETGDGVDGFFAELVQASHNWQAVRPEVFQVLNVRVDDDDQRKASAFVYHVCRNYRHEAQARGMKWDTPNDYHLMPSASIEKLTAQFLFEQCRRFKYEIFSDAGRWMHQAGYDIMACSQNQVECKKNELRCLGSCGGADGSLYNHDFATIIALTELSEFVLGDAFDDGAAADCTVRNYTFQVPVFDYGDAFKTWWARISVRSGMTAIDTEWCARSAASCSVIQRVLERGAGQLVFVNGAFRHPYSIVPPSPPPPPNPPPRTFRYGPDPPAPSPPPNSPPPYYAVRRSSRSSPAPPRTTRAPCRSAAA